MARLRAFVIDRCEPGRRHPGRDTKLPHLAPRTLSTCMNEDRRTYSVEGVQVCIFLLLFRCSMLSEYSHTLGSSINNRILQRSVVDVIFETSIHLVITQELRYDGGAVVVYCTVQCGEVEVAAV